MADADQSPYQQLQNDRLLATARALQGKMDTADFGRDGCGASLSAIIHLTTNQPLPGTRVPTIIANLTKEGELKRVGTADLADPRNDDLAGVHRGNIAAFCDRKEGAAEPQHHAGFLAHLGNSKAEGGEVLSNSSNAQSFSQTLPHFDGDLRVEYYELHATPENVKYMLAHVPRLNESCKLDGTCIVPTNPKAEPIKVPPHEDYTKPKDGWQMPGLERGKDGRPTKSPDNEFKSITLREAMYQAEHDKVFKYDFQEKGKHDPVAELQNETLARAVLSHLPPEKQQHYQEAMTKAGIKVDGPTAGELVKDIKGLPKAEAVEATKRIQLGIVNAKAGYPSVAEFKPEPNGLTQDQADQLNARLHKEIDNARPGHAMEGAEAPERRASNGTPIRQAPPNFTYSGQVDSVDRNSGSFVLVGGRNGNQAFEVQAEHTGGKLPEPGERVRVAPNSLEPVTPAQNRPAGMSIA
jgi:hypothetical protein